MAKGFKWLNILRRNIDGQRKTIFLKNSSLVQRTGNINYTDARIGNKLVGSIRSKIKKGDAQIRHISVAPEFRKKGIGLELLKKHIGFNKRLGADYIYSGEVVAEGAIKNRSKLFGTEFFKRDKKISTKKAMSIVKKEGFVAASTPIAGNVKDATISKETFKRIRVRGRWITVKRKK